MSPDPVRVSRRQNPAPDVQEFRAELLKFLRAKDDQGRSWTGAKWGVYAFYDYDGEPIYVGQTKEKLSGRIGRHLTNQRSDAVAMRVLDPFEVAEVEVWPLWDLQGTTTRDKLAADLLDAAEYSAYVKAIDESRFKAILNEKVPPSDTIVDLPPSFRAAVVSDEMRAERGHADVRIARRSQTISRLASVAYERGEVSDGLRRVLVIQAVRMAYLTAERLAEVQGRPAPDASAIDTSTLLGEAPTK